MHKDEWCLRFNICIAGLGGLSFSDIDPLAQRVYANAFAISPEEIATYFLDQAGRCAGELLAMASERAKL